MSFYTPIGKIRRNAELLYELVDERNTSGFVPKADVLEGYRQIIERCDEAIAGSAETGGEKAALQQFCQCDNDWTDGTGWCQECHLERRSREPEKLNNAQKSICELASEIWSIAQAVDNGGGRLESISHELEALAESSLSSPSGKVINVEGEEL